MMGEVTSSRVKLCLSQLNLPPLSSFSLSFPKANALESPRHVHWSLGKEEHWMVHDTIKILTEVAFSSGVV